MAEPEIAQKKPYGVEVELHEVQLPGAAPRFHLQRNRPNPFNPRTEIRFGLAERGRAKLVVYDVQGRRVRTLVDGVLAAGPHVVTWDGTDDEARRVASGLYLYRLTSGRQSATHRLLLVQ